MGKRILGIDPGSQHLGVGLIHFRNQKAELIFAEALSAPAKDPIYLRLSKISAMLESLLDRFTPDEVAVEDVFYKQNPRSVFHLGVARGVAIAACLRRGLPIFDYPPTQVKLAVTGHGRADKEQVKKMVQMIVGAQLASRHDASDAVAVAICHAHLRKFERSAVTSRRLQEETL